MRSVARRREGSGWASADALLELDEDYARVLSLLDRRSAFRAILAALPESVGIDVAFIGEVDADGKMVLGHAVHTRTDAVNGLVVPPGVGLGGRVLRTGQPQWVANYTDDAALATPFRSDADREGLKGMVGVPVYHAGRLIGVLYGSNRAETNYGDVAVAALEAAAARAANAAAVAERARLGSEVAVLEERRRLALELHDTVGAMLFTIGASVRRLTDGAAQDPALRAQLESIERQAAEAAAVFRESLQALNASPQDVALPVALRSDCRGFEDRTRIPVRLLVLDDLPPLQAARASALAATVREALLNVEKHARAGSVLVSVFGARDGVTVAIADDGAGLASDPAHGHGLGLAGVAERLGRLGGYLTVGGNDDGGVTVRGWVPG